MGIDSADYCGSIEVMKVRTRLHASPAAPVIDASTAFPLSDLCVQEPMCKPFRLARRMVVQVSGCCCGGAMTSSKNARLFSSLLLMLFAVVAASGSRTAAIQT